jgi:hypothetical protein
MGSKASAPKARQQGFQDDAIDQPLHKAQGRDAIPALQRSIAAERDGLQPHHALAMPMNQREMTRAISSTLFE